MSALQTINQRELLTNDDLGILKRSKFNNFTDAEVMYASKICTHLSLNPLLNQIHFVKRGNAVTAQVGIDGFRLIAQRAGGYAGSDDVIFEYDEKKHPIKAMVSVYRMIDGQRCQFAASARWSEYYQKAGGQWDRMPHLMLGKCAEALALRKAFPAELSGVYSPEEMAQADGPTKAQVVQEKLVEVEQVEPQPKTMSEQIQSRSGGLPPCNGCGQDSLMVSKYNANILYCKSCKGQQPI